MTDAHEIATRCVEKMLQNDTFSQWLGLEVLEITPGKAKLQMKVRDDMCNGFAVCHGGVLFSFADSAMAFAANTHGRVSLSIENNICYTAPITPGDILTAVAEEISSGNRIAVYQVTVGKQNGTTVGLFRGTVYRTKRAILDNNG